jgi:23S rRNA (pseudouridine1915-N3)-methyltransferase
MSSNKIRIIAIGKMSKDYESLYIHFTKMLQKQLQIIEIIPKYQDISLESDLIMQHISKDDFVITMEISGEALSSMEFAHKLSSLLSSQKRILFIIGGSNGIGENVKSRSNYSFSMSKFTFPHLLARIILIEQIYRSIAISNNHPYHK